MTRTVWGVVNQNGTIKSGDGFSITAQGNGEYIISFSPAFNGTPAITGVQVLLETTKQDPRDGIVFPFLNEGAATALVAGNDGKKTNRAFSFIAIGPE